ncbi:MAG: helix-turn-helix transcriptional regulator, partial [Candidatus Acidiferrales bacterium]
MLVLAHDAFFGDLQFSRTLDGITLSHRIANSPPAEVPTHTHSDAHFVLVTSGHYVSSARGDANRRVTLIYNPPGTKHRDHFWEGTGSFFTISLSAAKLAQSISTAQPVAVHLTKDRACGLTRALLMECARWNSRSQLKAESLCMELLAEVSDIRLSGRRLPPQWLRAACELVQDCPGGTTRIRDVAKTVGVHTAHLARAFRAFLGCTPGDLLRARRIELAAAALMNSDRSLVEIALESGFA